MSTSDLTDEPDQLSASALVSQPAVRRAGESSRANPAPASPHWNDPPGGAVASPDNPRAGGMSLAEYLEIPFAHKRLIFVCVGFAIVMAWAAIIFWPRKYYSESKLIVRVGRESVALDPTATTGQTLMLQKTQEEEINSVLAVLSSRHLAEGVISQLGAEAILDGTVQGGSGSGQRESAAHKLLNRTATVLSDALHFALMATGIRDDISDDELAVMRLQDNLIIQSPKKSTVVSVRAEAKSPEAAQAIVQTLTRDFLAEHVRVSSTEGSQQFFVEQAEQAELLLNDLLDQRKELLKQYQVASVESKRETLTNQLAEIERDLLVAQSSLEQYEAEIADLLVRANTSAAEIVAAKEQQSDTTWSAMRNRLYELEMQEKELTSKLSDDHPRLLAIREQLTGARDILARVESERENTSMTPNPVRVRLQEDLQQKQTSVVGLKSLIVARESQRERTLQSINDLVEFELKLDDLDRRIALASSNLRLLQDKREEARVIDELQSEQISNVSIFQPASLVYRPFSPNKKLLAAGFVVLGLMGGLGLAYTREINSTQVRRPEHLATGLSVPLVGTMAYEKALARSRRLARAKFSASVRETLQSLMGEVLLSRSQQDVNEGRGCAVGILGCSEGSGASTIAALLSKYAAEEAGLRTILLDADTKNRSVSRLFGLSEGPGLAELLDGDASRSECEQSSTTENLRLVASSSPSEPRPLRMHAGAVADVLEDFRSHASLIIVDLPSANRPEQLAGLAQQLDHVLLVVESDRHDVSSLSRIVQRLRGGGLPLKGIVLSKAKNYLPRVVNRILVS